MLDDIDYSALQGTTEAPKAKPTVSDRSVVKKEKLERKRIDEEKLGQSADKLLESMGEPSTGDSLTEYALPAIGVLGALSAAYAAWKKGQSSADYSKQKPGEFSVPADQKGTQAVQSVEKNVAEAATVDKIEQLQQRVEAGRAAGIGQTPVPGGAVPKQTANFGQYAGETYNVPTSNLPAVQGGVAPTTAPASVSPTMASQSVSQTPTTATEAVVTGQSPSKAVQLDVAKMLDESSNGGFKEYIKKAEQIKGTAGAAVSPETRRTKSEMAVYKEETPLNRGFNQFSEMVGGKKYPNEMLKAWEDVRQNVWQGEMPKGQGGKMQFADQTEQYLRANAEKYPNLVRNLEERAARAAQKQAVVPPQQGGFINVSAPTQLTPFGQGVANVGRQVVGDLKMGAAMVPFMLSTDVRQQDVGYKRELQDQLKQEKDPARAQTLKNELDKLEEGRYLQAMYNRFVQKNTMQQYRPALTR